MKKLMSLCVLFLCAILAKAQGLGDYMEIDGIGGFVFYVDETGEHGLVMSGAALDPTSKAAKRIAKTSEKFGTPPEVLAASGTLSKMTLPIPKKLSSKEKKKIFAELTPLLSDNGEQNAMAIENYCNEKGYAMQDYFPAQYWAQQLGEGWFIPGDKELNLFADFFCGGVGKENGLSFQKWLSHAKEKSIDPMVQTQISGFAITGINSSTAKSAKAGGFRTMLHVKNAFKSWFEFFDEVNVKGVSVSTCAVHKF